MGRAEIGSTDARANSGAPVREVEGTLQNLGSLFTLASGDLETEGEIKCDMPLRFPLIVLENCFSLTCFRKLRYNSHTVVVIHLKCTVQ